MNLKFLKNRTKENITGKKSNRKNILLKWKNRLCFFILSALIFYTNGAVSETLKIKLWEFQFKGKHYSITFKTELKNNKLNLSSAIDSLKKIFKESNYDNYSASQKIESFMQKNISKLCESANQQEECKQRGINQLSLAFEEIEEEMSNRILYPDTYRPIENTSRFEKAMKELNSANNCEKKSCSIVNSVFLSLAIRYETSQHYSTLYDKIKNKDEHCKKTIINDLIHNLEKERVPKKCLQTKNKNHIVCKNMLRDINIIRGRVYQLMGLIYSPEEINTAEAKALCTLCEWEYDDEEIQNLKHLIKTLEEQSQCYDPKPGEKKVVQDGKEQNRSYVVQREPDGSFSIPLNIKFSADTDYDGLVPKNQVHSHYMKKVKECMKKANSKMLGPKGEKLKIVIQDPSPIHSKAKDSCAEVMKNTIPIKISSQHHRSSSGKYASDIDCPTITHEVLHLMGLCDEYEENTLGYYVNSKTGKIVKEGQAVFLKPSDEEELVFKSGFDCRVTGSSNNIMAGQSERWQSVFQNKKHYPSLLNPGQFNSILYGSCEAKNKLFNKCSKLAYKSSVKTEANCLKEKEECLKQNAMGEDKQATINTLSSQIRDITQLRKAYLKNMKEEYHPKIYEELITIVEQKLQSLTKKLDIAKSWPDP